MTVPARSPQPFGEFLRERVFGPLGMKDTGFHVPADQIHRLPPLYAPDPTTGEFHITARSLQRAPGRTTHAFRQRLLQVVQLRPG